MIGCLGQVHVQNLGLFIVFLHAQGFCLNLVTSDDTSPLSSFCLSWLLNLNDHPTLFMISDISCISSLSTLALPDAIASVLVHEQAQMGLVNEVEVGWGVVGLMAFARLWIWIHHLWGLMFRTPKDTQCHTSRSCPHNII